MKTKARCIAAIERRIRHYYLIKNAEDRLSAWYMVTGYLEAMYDAEVISIEEYQMYSEKLDNPHI